MQIMVYAGDDEFPPSSQVLVETRPIAADAFAPRLPTMAESMYCITMEEICVKIAGMLSCHTRRIC